jgi:hypothetical protein
MMPAPHPGMTRRFGAPKNWQAEVDGSCGVLEIADLVEGRRPVMESLWRPDPDELAALLVGGAVILRIGGDVHPVVSVGVTAIGSDAHG